MLLVDGLAAVLGDPDKAVARAASDALTELAGTHSEAGDAVRRALHSDDPRRRWGAAFTRARLSPPDPALLPATVEALASEDGDVRWAAAKLLVDMGRLHGEVLSVVLGLASQADSPAARRMALFCLRELAPDDPHAAAALMRATDDSDRAHRRAAYTALAALLDPPPGVLDRLARALAGDSDPVIRRLAAVALGELGLRNPGPVAERAAAHLGAVADDDDPELLRAATRAAERLNS